MRDRRGRGTGSLCASAGHARRRGRCAALAADPPEHGGALGALCLPHRLGGREDHRDLVGDVVDVVLAGADRDGRGQVGGEIRVVDHPVVEGGPHPTDLVQQHPRVGGTQLAVTRGRAGDERVDVRRDAGDLLRRGGDVLVHVLVGDLDRGVALVRLPAGEHLVDHHPGGVDVGAGVGPAVDDQLGGEVGDGADQHPAGGGVLGLGAHRAGEPEVGDLDPAVVGKKHVLRFHVAVDQAGLVGGGERGENRVDQRQHPSRGHRGVLADQVAQGVPGDVLHGQEQGAVVVALVEDADHVRVRQPGGGAGLAHEASREVVVVAETRVHHLHRAGPVQAQIRGLVDGGHAPAGDLRADAVATVEHTPDHRVRDSPVHVGRPPVAARRRGRARSPLILGGGRESRLPGEPVGVAWVTPRPR